MTQSHFISVVLPLKLEWEPCYSVPEEMHPVQIGDRVRVLFAGKTYIGVISATDITPETEISKIRPILNVERGMGKIFPQEISLWRQVAEYYLCTIGEVYKAAYPIGKVHLEEAKAKAEEKQQQRLERQADALKVRIAKLTERLSKKQEQIEKAKKDSTREAYTEQAEGIKEEIVKLERQAALIPGHPLFGSEMKEGTKGHPESCAVPELSGAQQKALSEIKNAFTEDKPALIHGVTGSGKTEIYTRLALEVISGQADPKKGRNVLYLVPEIALSRQLEDRLYGYFGDRLLTFHSGITAASRRDIAEKIRSSSEGYVVLGTRSALFLPHHDLGLIIIDEEHDNSYKQDSPAPRYNGRDTALMLARIQGADVVMGSATPSLESLYNCQYGKHRLVRLEERYHGSENSEIEIIDTKAERRKRGMRGNFSIKLIEHIRRTLDAGEQVIILRSRRAYSPVLQCQNCGELQKCPHCNVTYSWHRPIGQATGTQTLNGTPSPVQDESQKQAAGKSVCHHCGWNAPFENRCSVCGGPLQQFGAGTQKIEEEAAALFPQARIARLDSDTAQNRNFEVRTIRDFSNGDIDILMGTQIISKGFDFSNLSLVVVISADTLLAMQDFRADEKAVQLMEQLRGRCGRRGRKGLFVIQTSQPQHPVYQRLTENDAQQFSMDLLQERKDFGFPPYSRIIALTIKDMFEDRAQRMAFRLAAELRKAMPGITGPYPPTPDKIADQFLRCIRISLPKDRNLVSHKNALKEIVASFEKENKYQGHITIDIDPV